MKAFGHELAKYDTDADSLLALGEVSIIATPKKLRQLAQFMIKCADEADKGNHSDHYHYNNDFMERPQFVICIEPKAGK